MLSGAGIRDLHNGDIVDLFPNGDGIHGRVLHLLDSCCGKILLGARSVEDMSIRGVMGYCAIGCHVTS